MKKNREGGYILMLCGLTLVPLLILVSMGVNSGLLVTKKLQHRGTAMALAMATTQYMRSDGGLRNHTRVKQAIWFGEYIASRNSYVGSSAPVSSLSAPPQDASAGMSGLIYGNREGGALAILDTPYFDRDRVNQFFSGRSSHSGVVFVGNYDHTTCKTRVWDCFTPSNKTARDMMNGDANNAVMVVLNESNATVMNVLFDFFNSAAGLGGKHKKFSSWAMGYAVKDDKGKTSFYVYNT